MNTVTLGRTGLRVSVMGLGCGGYSCLGLRTHGEERALAVVRSAVEAGVNILDTAENYRNEHVVGRALAELGRDSLVVATKTSPRKEGGPKSAADLRAALEGSLRRLGTDTIDVYFLHGVQPKEYDHAAAELVPELERQRRLGKVRWIGATEAFGPDPDHGMLRRALADDWCDVAMVGFNVLNQTARTLVFPTTRARNVGTLIMMAVRHAMCRPARLREVMAELIAKGAVDPAAVDPEDALGFLVYPGGAASVMDGAYRFARFEPGADVVLSGTGSVDHLTENLATFSRGPLPEADVERLKTIFGSVDCTFGD